MVQHSQGSGLSNCKDEVDPEMGKMQKEGSGLRGRGMPVRASRQVFLLGCPAYIQVEMSGGKLDGKVWG